MLKLGLSDTQAKIMSCRFNNVGDAVAMIKSSFQTIPELSLMSGIDAAADIIHSAIQARERVAIVTDYDSDGVNSAIVLHEFIDGIFGAADTLAIINKRINGNGITRALLDAILYEHFKEPIGLVITADHGSSNGQAIDELKQHGIKVCVTDHHKIPKEGNANNADAFVNPQKDTGSPFAKISGCTVAYYTVLHTFNKYRSFYNDEKQIVRKCLPMVAIATIGDSMNMANPINRSLVRTGLREMNSLIDPHWVGLRKILEVPWLFDEETVSFSFVPMINAASRMGNPMDAFDFYTSDRPIDIETSLVKLSKINKERRKVQNDLTLIATMEAIHHKDDYALAICLEKGFGINGIISSKVGSMFYKPIVTFVLHGDVYEGSGRSINKSFNLLRAFEHINSKDGDIFVKFGGHDLAAGCSIKKDKADDFRRLFNEEAKEQLGVIGKPVFEVVEYLPHEHLNMQLLVDVASVGPYGEGYSKPTYAGIFIVSSLHLFGKQSFHAKVGLRLNTGKMIEAMMFNASDNDYDRVLEDCLNKMVRAVYNVVLNTYMGNNSVELRLLHVEPV